jgi:hypothetical protein
MPVLERLERLGVVDHMVVLVVRELLGKGTVGELARTGLWVVVYMDLAAAEVNLLPVLMAVAQ